MVIGKPIAKIFSCGAARVMMPNEKLINNIELKIHQSFHILDLSEEQENYFVCLLQEEIERLSVSMDLSNMYEQAQQCLEELQITSGSSVESDNASNGDIMLF